MAFRGLATFKGVIGLNCFWPLGGPEADTGPDGKLRFRPAPNTFLFAHAPSSVRHLTPAVIKQIKDAGFDHLRIQYHPGLIMQAIDQNDATFQEYVLKFFDDVMNTLYRAGLGCILSGIPTGYANLYGTDYILGGINSPGWVTYKKHLTVLANRFKNLDPKLFMMEIMNEPPGNGTDVVRQSPNWGNLYTGNWETQYQPDGYRLLRQLMPLHTIGMTSDGWSNWETLQQIKPANIPADSNLLWSFHPIFPVPVAEAGYIYNQYKHVIRLAYPPGANGQTYQTESAKMQAHVNADPTLSAADKQNTIAGLNYDLAYYFNTPQDYSWIKACFVACKTWATNNGINPNNVHAGEYGATRDNQGFPNNVLGFSSGYLGATRLDRIHLYRDVSRACFECGFRQDADHLDTLDFGITFGQNNVIGQFDPLILQAIDPKNKPWGFA